MPLDSNLAALLTIPVQYAAKNGGSEYGGETWADPVELLCYPSQGARQVQKRDGTVYLSEMALYFDGSDETVQGFQLGDRFTAPGIAGGQVLEAVEIAPSYSPGPSIGAPQEAWLVEVVL